VENNKPGRSQSHVQKIAAMRMARADTPVEDPYKSGSTDQLHRNIQPQRPGGRHRLQRVVIEKFVDEKAHDHGDAMTIDLALQPRRKGSNESTAKKKGLR
jgi:hypothetical protein